MNEILNNLSWYKKIEVLRVSKGWTQEETANKCCTSSKTYWNWEKGISYPRKLSRNAIARTFGIKVEEIFEKEEEKVS